MDAKVRTRMEAVKRMADDPRTPVNERANAKARYDAMVAKYGQPETARASTTRTNRPGARSFYGNKYPPGYCPICGSPPGSAHYGNCPLDVNGAFAEAMRDFARSQSGAFYGFDFGRGGKVNETAAERAERVQREQERNERVRREAEEEAARFADIRRRNEESRRRAEEQVNAQGIVNRSREFLESLGCTVLYDPRGHRWAVFRGDDCLLKPTNAIEMVKFARKAGFDDRPNYRWEHHL